MALPPPNENLLYTTKCSTTVERLAGSYNGPYLTRNWWTETWRKKDRAWVRVPKGLRHLTNPYTAWLFEAEPMGQYAYTWRNCYTVGFQQAAYDYCKMAGDLYFAGPVESWLATKATVSSTDALLTTVRNSVLKQAAGQTFNAALFTAEAGKVLNLLTTNARKIYRSFREIKTGRLMGRSLKETVRRACSALGIVNSKKWDPKASRASQWLEYRYGVETLMMDVRDAAEYAASKMSDQPERYKWRSSKAASSDVVTDYPSSWGQFLGVYQSGILLDPMRVLQTVTTAQAWLEAELETSGYRSMQQLGFANPVGMAWELIPLSFVADWALNIGSYLDLQTSLWGLKVLDAGYSLKREAYAEVTVRPATPTTGSDPYHTKPFVPPAIWVGATTRSYKGSRYQRWAWVNPSPEYTLGSGLDIKRTVDSVALLFLGFRK